MHIRGTYRLSKEGPIGKSSGKFVGPDCACWWNGRANGTSHVCGRSNNWSRPRLGRFPKLLSVTTCYQFRSSRPNHRSKKCSRRFCRRLHFVTNIVVVVSLLLTALTIPRSPILPGSVADRRRNRDAPRCGTPAVASARFPELGKAGPVPAARRTRGPHHS